MENISKSSVENIIDEKTENFSVDKEKDVSNSENNDLELIAKADQAESETIIDVNNNNEKIVGDFNLKITKNKIFVCIIIVFVGIFAIFFLLDDENKHMVVNYLNGASQGESDEKASKSNNSKNNNISNNNKDKLLFGNNSNNGQSENSEEDLDYAEDDSFSELPDTEFEKDPTEDEPENDNNNPNFGGQSPGPSPEPLPPNPSNPPSPPISPNPPTSSDDYINDNNVLRKKLESKYNIGIILNNEYSQSQLNNYIETPLLDGYKNNKILMSLEKELRRYPDNFFNEFKIGSRNIKIIFGFAELLKQTDDSYRNTSTMSTRYKDTIQIYIVDSNSFGFNFHYNIMRAVDYFLNIKNGSNLGYNNWNGLNPSGFRYGNIETKYDYSYNRESAYFLDYNCQLDEGVDRSTIFAHLMTDSRVNTYFKPNHKIYIKAKEIVSNISRNFASCSDRIGLNSWNSKIK